jgi:hypothetical protein
MKGKPIQKSRIQEFKNPRMMRCGTRRQIVGSSWLLGFLVSWLLGNSPAFAGPAPAAPNVSASRASAPIAYLTVNHLGESDQQAALKEGQLLSHRRTTDPFGITIRGPFKGLPPVVEHPVAPVVQTAASQAAAAVNVPTLERALQELSIGGVNVGRHEILIGSRSIREGDLLVLESGGQQFVVWLQSVEVRGVMFCDIDLQKHILKPFGSPPKDLPGDSARGGIPDIRHFLNKDAQP